MVPGQESRSINERTPLLPPLEHSVGSNGAEPPAIESGEAETTSLHSSGDGGSCKGSSSSRSPVTVVLVLIVGWCPCSDAVVMRTDRAQGVFIAQLDTSFVLATHTNIASEFGQLESSSWLIASYALAMCAVQPCVCCNET
jgi:hypothetical protein